jgi:hypothetical protein
MEEQQLHLHTAAALSWLLISATATAAAVPGVALNSVGSQQQLLLSAAVPGVHPRRQQQQRQVTASKLTALHRQLLLLLAR